MALDTHYQKIRYLEQAKRHLVKLYGVENDKSQAYHHLKSRLDGFIEAGLVVCIVDNSELQDLIDAAHMNAFGMTRKQRRAESQLASKDTAFDWALCLLRLCRMEWRLEQGRISLPVRLSSHYYNQQITLVQGNIPGLEQIFLRK